jgi:hypothetical protein
MIVTYSVYYRSNQTKWRCRLHERNNPPTQARAAKTVAATRKCKLFRPRVGLRAKQTGLSRMLCQHYVVVVVIVVVVVAGIVTNAASECECDAFARAAKVADVQFIVIIIIIIIVEDYYGCRCSAVWVRACRCTFESAVLQREKRQRTARRHCFWRFSVTI